MENKIIEIFKKTGAILPNDHFVGASGLHFDTYINKNTLFLHPEETSEVCKLIAEKYQNNKVEVVASPALGGIILSQWVAYHLSKLNGQDVLSVFSEKGENDEQILKRNYDQAVKNKKVLIVEDVITTGGSMLKTVEAVKNAGGEVVGVCALVNKNPKKVNAENLGFPFTALADFETVTYKAEDCPLCKDSLPINTNVGHGKDFLKSK